LVARTLITTANEQTWPKDKNEPVLFLGEWCKRYSRKHIWEAMDYEVASYHWDDRNKLFTDYQYIQRVYEELLTNLSKKLNKIHNTNHNIRYWRVLVGPWLGYFIGVVFDRWFMIQSANDSFNIKSCYLLYRENNYIEVNDMSEFLKVFVKDDWNELLYAQLIKEYWMDDIELTNIFCDRFDKERIIKEPKKRLKSYVTNKLLQVYNKILAKDDDIFFISSYLPLRIDFILQSKLGQFPKIWKSRRMPKSSPNIEARQWVLNITKDVNQGKDGFSEIIGKLISKHIPVAYLEGYSQLVESTHNLPWPRNPKLIFTSNSYSSDDLFKCWSAEKIEQGAPLIVGQHGGHFGMNTFSFHEEHQIKISDRWISWGWSDTQREKITPIGNLKAIGKDVKYDPKGGALMVEMDLPRYSYHLYSVPVANQWLDYFQDQKLFLNTLPRQLRSQILLRLGGDHGWDQLERWSNAMPELKINPGVGSIHKLINKSRIFISTYNATTYLESLSWNIPTIIFWNPDHWELNKEAKPYFELLKLAGIFHETPESAARQMIEVWGDVDEWWKSEKVQNAKNVFCYQYARISSNSLDELEATFSSVINND